MDKNRYVKIIIKKISRARYNLSGLRTSINRFFGKKAISAHWFAGRKNFGDLITPLLLNYFGFETINAPIDSAEVLVVGSLLNAVSENYDGTILGSGLMHECPRNLKKARILALRGALTRDVVNASKDVPLGDPALLVSRYFKKGYSKEYVLGIVPHHVDKHDERINMISSRYKDDVKIIDVGRDPLEVIADIEKCQHILSSSLHGVVVADSLKIPSGWLLLSDKVYGKGFKFHDHASALHMKILPNEITGFETLSELIKFTRLANDCIEEIQTNLENAFEVLVQEFS